MAIADLKQPSIVFSLGIYCVVFVSSVCEERKKDWAGMAPDELEVGNMPLDDQNSYTIG